MEFPVDTQPVLGADSLGQFAEATTTLAKSGDRAALQLHVERLARLTNSDLALLYESPGAAANHLELVAQTGLRPDSERDFATLGNELTLGAGGLRAESGSSSPLAYQPLTQDLLALGIRAYWAYPLWSSGKLIGQLFFGSRNWDQFHKDTLSVFAAATLQIGGVLEKRRLSIDSDLSKSSEEAAAAAKKREFIAVLAHELRNPIAPIRSGLDLLSTGMLDAEAQRSTTQMMQRQVAHLVRLIDDLLDTVRLTTGRLQVRREPVVLREVVRSAIESIRPALAAKSQALRLDDEAADVVVDVDPVRLSQAFVNILSANVKQTPESGVIAVSIAARDAELVIAFADEGPRVDRNELQNVFELFPHSAMQQSDDGVGIGLALVKGLVELNDGTVEMRNRESANGTVYLVTLPASKLDRSALTEPSDQTSAWPSHRILVVDDNRDAADTLGLLFELDGHTVRLAHDGPNAVTEAREFQPEIILIDIGLPGFSGNEAVRRIRAEAPAVRPFIIALTGWGAPSDIDASRDAGCDLHLVKPVSHDELRTKVTELTKRKEDHGRE